MQFVRNNPKRTIIYLLALLLLATTQWGCRLISQPAPPRIASVLERTSGWSGFARPQEDEPPELVMLRPYAPGKIPVVFIHGLLSQPGTWNDMIESLDADPKITARYQFWVFRYPTGVSYLQSAHDLRTQLTAGLNQVDPLRRDPALTNMVLVGHSMGGLLSKLQVTQR